jgi:hypothetical protein
MGGVVAAQHVNQDICRFQITMHDAATDKVSDAFQQLQGA